MRVRNVWRFVQQHGEGGPDREQGRTRYIKALIEYISSPVWAALLLFSAFMPASATLTRRALGVAVGVSAATAILYSNNSLPAPIRATLASRVSSQPVVSQSLGMQASPTATGLPPPRTPVKAVNIRDIGEVDPRLRKGVLYRCSQIYTPEVLKELKVSRNASSTCLHGPAWHGRV